MARLLQSQGKPYRLIYLTRERQSTAFADLLNSPDFAAQVVMHHDQGDPNQAMDLWPLLEKAGSVQSLQLYCCGPQGLMDAVLERQASHAVALMREHLQATFEATAKWLPTQPGTPA